MCDEKIRALAFFLTIRCCEKKIRRCFGGLAALHGVPSMAQMIWFPNALRRMREGNTGPSCLTFVVRSALTRRLQLPEPPVLYERRVHHYAGCLCTWPFRFSRGILHTITSAKSLRGKRIRVELASKITNSPRPAISWCVCQRGNLVQLFSVAHQCRRLVRRRKRRHGAPGYVYFNFSLVSGDSRADHLHGGGLEED